MRISNENLIDGVAPVDLSTDVTLRPVWLGHIAQYAIQLTFSNDPDGIFTLQCSNDAGHPNAQSKAEQSADVVNWTDIAGSSQTVTETGNIVWNAENVGYTWVRVVWAANAGAGTLETARAMMKGV